MDFLTDKGTIVDGPIIDNSKIVILQIRPAPGKAAADGVVGGWSDAHRGAWQVPSGGRCKPQPVKKPSESVN